ncbi:ExeA family protein [Nitrosovibrio sp. Nv4]|uniref:ExeA family protein n=1 Tax=Nitrosovibrio sp. Nv4 TaxID=1945880 RepID=UPI000BD7328D|nr:AAA family ATPase [Nitrosovibrio sp. Nv4]SOD40136.1 Type II secretory pathway, component ExeA (predicted ATPase) [Nitrosovibrio sp. Nv4]
MYLGHFGLSEPPFAHSSTTDFFYEGANRGATLDALIYVLTHGEGAEGVIQVTGDAGSGKTTLCRSLMKRLPARMQTVYVAKPDLSREEFLRSIADELNFGVAESCTTAARSTHAIEELQRALAEKHTASRQVVLLMDEAHAMSAEVLEDALTLYDLESSCHKLLQIVLFGQPQLKDTLGLPQIRKFKDRFTHHFVLQPFNAKAVAEYLMCRVRDAGYRGPGIFSAEAIRMIARASSGLIRRVDILADKSMLAASRANAREIKAQHVKAAFEDDAITTRFHWRDSLDLLSYRTVSARIMFSTLAVGMSALGWQALSSSPTEVASIAALTPLEARPSVRASITAPAPVPAPVYPASTPSSASAGASAPSVPPSISSKSPPGSSQSIERVVEMSTSPLNQSATAAEQPRNTRSNIAGVKLEEYALLAQRVGETRKAVAATDPNFYTIHLFATDNVQPDRMERFLVRARGVIDLSDLYVHPVTDGDQAKFRVTYGIYSSRDEATAAVAELPQKYQSSFHAELYTLSELR